MTTLVELGSKVTITEKVPASEIYPFATSGAEGRVVGIQLISDYPYQIRFEGEHVVDPRGCPVIVKDPTLLFTRDEIKLKEES